MNTQDERLSKWLANWVSKQGFSSPPRVEPLAGDGSTRCFYRLRFSDSESRILLSDPHWLSSKDYPQHQAYLTQRGIPVPRFFTIDPDSGFLVMEDFGDELLQLRVIAQSTLPQTKLGWLEKATRLLARFHGATFPVPSDLAGATRAFDTEKYSQELAFTFEHLHEKLLGLAPQSEEMKNALLHYCENLDRMIPRVLCHRDYHTRNLLVKNESLFLIDFQDARMGPPHYDLASLLYDAYVPVSKSDREFLIASYRQELSAYSVFHGVVWNHFDADLELVALQRTVKAAGSFASFYTRNGKKTHLPYLLPALHSALELRQSLAKKHPELKLALPIETWIDSVGKLKI